MVIITESMALGRAQIFTLRLLLIIYSANELLKRVSRKSMVIRGAVNKIYILKYFV